MAASGDGPMESLRIRPPSGQIRRDTPYIWRERPQVSVGALSGGSDLEHRDVHVVVMVRGDATAVRHRLPAGRRDADVPDVLPVDDVHDPQPGGVRLGPRRDVVALLDVRGV